MGTEKKNGFTIIEVLIVLAIAGLILVIILVAVPQMRRLQRDTGRKRFATSVPNVFPEYFTNNRRYPVDATTRQDFVDDYIVIQQDPSSGLDYVISFRDPTANHADVPPVGEVYIQQGNQCNIGADSDGSGNPISGDDSGFEEIVVLIGTESGQYFCIDNS